MQPQAQYKIGRKESECGARRVGYAYVPVQIMKKVYSPQAALCEGTVFPELNIPIGVYERGLYNGK